ncbi:oleosin G-like [Impatiens glandulifera]|uniref:oleosin G-like n=1 Tax=Impatiens glandulifera TaxID=253017 RepID=UPI001FB101DD|nr:oleosin G-like [Impatiens glandulifera]
MADRQGGQSRRTRQQRGPLSGSLILNRLQKHRPSTCQVFGMIALAISGGILLLLTALTMTATVIGIMVFSPFLIISSPIWVPFAALILFVVAGFLSMFCFGVVAVAALAWAYRYLKGFHPPGSDRVDYARSRIACTASHVKDYAREYGEYLHNKVKDAAPGA